MVLGDQTGKHSPEWWVAISRLSSLPKDMLRKTNTQKGFTIIEVVITIAIGAAVMALVLNAVAGARRSQRNNARAADVNQVAAGVNQFIASRNRLPADWSEISTIIDDGDKFGHYEASSINPAASWITTGAPTANGDFPVVGGGATPTTAIVATATALGPGDTNTTTNAADSIVVFQQAGCSSTSLLAQGGIREMAIVYRLEGQGTQVCIEV